MTETTLADDILRGAAEIAPFIGETVRRTEYLLERGCLPAFKSGARWRMRKSTYLNFLERLESRGARVAERAAP